MPLWAVRLIPLKDLYCLSDLSEKGDKRGTTNDLNLGTNITANKTASAIKKVFSHSLILQGVECESQKRLPQRYGEKIESLSFGQTLLRVL